MTSVRYDKVLAAVSLNPNTARDAIHHAIALAAPEATVYVTHVTSAPDDETQEKARAEEIHELLRPLVPESARDRVSLRVVFHHDPVQGIVRDADACDADAISVCARGHTALFGVVLGSFVTDLLAATERPVLVIRPKS